jgi:hypothetical protein
MHSLTLREMAVSFPWPTREMAGAEVLPIRSMRPEEKTKWLQQLWGMLTIEKNKDAARGRDRARSGSSSTSNARFEAPRPNTARAKSPLSLTGRSQSPPEPPFIVNAPPVAQLETLSLNALADPSSSPSVSPASAASLRRSNATSSRLWPGTGTGAAVSPTTPDRLRRFSNARNLAVPGEATPYYHLSDGEDCLSSGDEKYLRPRSPSLGVPLNRSGDMGLTRLLSVKRPNDSVLSDAMALALFRVDED